MTVRKQKPRTIKYDDAGEPYVVWRTKKIPVSAFYREPARFVDWTLSYWHAMDCTRDLAIHLETDGETYVLGKVSA